MNKISKGKAVGLLSLGLASVALGSVGFASWVISTTDANDTENVTVTVGEVSDQRITITAALNAGDPSVTLDAKTGQGNNSVITGSGDTAEDLTFKVDVTGKKGAGYTDGTYNCKFAVAFPTAINDGTYVTVDTVKKDAETISTYASSFGVPVSEDPGTTSIYTFTLKWGSAFNYKNPALMTDDDITAAGGIDVVIANLKKVKTAFTGETNANKIQVTLTSAA